MEKHILKTLMIAGAFICGCSGNVDPNETEQENAKPVEPYTLSVDKTAIEADGNDAATFKITDANGLDLTGSQYIKNTSFHIEETDEYFSGMVTSKPNVFKSIENGTYTITAMYSGKQCANSVSVKVQNRSKYEVFHKNVAIYRLSATWCGNCPSMGEALANVNNYTKGHSIVLEFHNTDEYSISYGSSDLADFILKRFGKDDDGYPFCLYSLYEGSSSKRTVMDIQDFVKKQLYDNPARTGIKAESAVGEENITVNITVKASEAGKYDLGIALLEDNCIPTSETATEKEYNDVVRTISGNFFTMSTDAFNLVADEEKQIEKTLSSELIISDESNYRIVLFTLREAGDKVIIDNATELSLNDNVEYAYN